MIGFWILAALTLLVAYAFFAPTFLGKSRRSAVDRQKLNLKLHKERSEELAREFSGEELARLQAELDKDLLGDLAAVGNAEAKPQKKGYGTLFVALALAPMLGVLLYSQLGRFDLADFRAAPQAPEKPVGAPEFQEMIERLAQRLKTEGGDLRGWLLLARSYQQVEQFDKAVEAYTQAMKLDPENLDIKAAYAESLGESMEGNYTGEPARIATEILAKNPKQPSALWLAGAAAAQEGKTEQAIAYLETLRGELPKDSPDVKHISKIIDDLKNGPSAEEASGEGEAAAGAEEPATGEQLAITVKVSLSPALIAKAKPDDAVFIFARAAAGPPMPLAIVRKQVKDLPVEVTLDDSMAMVQGMNLSAFDQLVIGARVSKTGQALPKPGDLQGLSRPMEIEDGGSYTIEISEELK
jgi:cytochrome c-type biogenesis protein CcmH